MKVTGSLPPPVLSSLTAALREGYPRLMTLRSSRATEERMKILEKLISTRKLDRRAVEAYPTVPKSLTLSNLLPLMRREGTTMDSVIGMRLAMKKAMADTETKAKTKLLERYTPQTTIAATKVINPSIPGALFFESENQKGLASSEKVGDMAIKIPICIGE
jgi:hypothetical protein